MAKLKAQAMAEKHYRRVSEWMPGLVALAVLVAGCVVVLKPFFSALAWAIVLSYVLYPLQRLFVKWFGGLRSLAAFLVVCSVVVIVTGPLLGIGFSLAEDGRKLALATRDRVLAASDEPPQWMAQVPFWGDELAAYWTDFATGKRAWVEQLERAASGEPAPTGSEPRIEPSRLTIALGNLLAGLRKGLLGAGINLAQGVFELFISGFLLFFLLRDGEALGQRCGVVVERLAGARGRHLLGVAEGTVRGVVYGMLGTALVQGAVALLGFWIAGVPGALLLGVLTFFLAVVPFGPPLLWAPSALWLFSQNEPGWGIFMLIWGALAISSVDNVLRPLLISQGSKMPFVLIFLGLIGGVVAFGLVGIFVGPLLLAVAFRLLDEWSSANWQKPRPAHHE